MSEDKRRRDEDVLGVLENGKLVLDVDKVIIRADKIIIVENEDRKHHRNSDVGGERDHRDDKQHRDHFEDERKDRRHPFWM